jgi:subtilisin family serine protease
MMRSVLSAIAFSSLMISSGSGAQFNGHDLERLSVYPVSVKGKVSESNDQVMILPYNGKIFSTFLREDGLFESFQEHGLDLIGTIGFDGLLVEGDAQSLLDLGLECYTIQPVHKYRLLLVQQVNESGDESMGFIVYFAGDEGLVKEKLLTLGEVTGQKKGRIGLRLSGDNKLDAIKDVASLPQVYSVQLAGGATLFNVNGRRIVQSASTSEGAETFWQRGLRGEGQVIAVLDTGTDPLSCFFIEEDGSLPPIIFGSELVAGDMTRRKIIAYDLLPCEENEGSGLTIYDNQGHGTAVSGNAAASQLGAEFSVSSSDYNGVAPAAKLVIQDAGARVDNCADLPALGCPVMDITAILEQAYFQGARIHNSSWGDRENIPPYNTYTATCIDMDEMAWNNLDFLPVVAAGNSGSGFGTVSSPSVAKNTFSVGGTQSPSYNSIVSFSSTGWAEDGRYKPDVVAPAQTITASRVGEIQSGMCLTRSAQGTSMSSPMACGSAALVRQYFEEGWYPEGRKEAANEFNPSSALVKAVLINGATPLTTEEKPPSRRQGWGRIHLENSLYFEGDEKKLIVFDEWDYFQNVSEEPFEVTVYPTGSVANRAFKVSLVYTDYPGTAGANPSLVNDLDLELETNGEVSFLGNHFDSETGYSLVGDEGDRINNVEVISLPVLEAEGVIRVHPVNILHGGQGFALVISGALESPVAVNVSSGWMLE